MLVWIVFTTPIEGGWKVAWPDAVTLQEVDEEFICQMLSGTPPELEYNGVLVNEVKYIIPDGHHVEPGQPLFFYALLDSMDPLQLEVGDVVVLEGDGPRMVKCP